MDAPLVIMRREEVAELVREAVRDERAAILAELRLLVLPAATAAPHEVERLLTADEMARALGMGRTVFFKQKTAYEISRSDWSSDVCSSDLRTRGLPAIATAEANRARCSRVFAG